MERRRTRLTTFRNSVEDTRDYRSADIGSDHYLVCATIKLRLRRASIQRRNRRVKYNTLRLKEEGVRNAFKITLRNKFQALEEEGGKEEEENEAVAMEVNEVERDFRIMKEAYTEVAEAVLGKPRKKYKPWISVESWRLIDQRQQINEKILSTRSERVKGQLKTKYKEKNKEVKRSLKSGKKKWIQNIAFEPEEAAGRQQMKTQLYDLTKKLCNERPRNNDSAG